MGKNDQFMFKKCACGAIKRAQQFKKHAISKEHYATYIISACLHCKVFKSGNSNNDFYKQHANCPFVQAVNYVTDDVGKCIGEFFTNVERDLDSALEHAVLSKTQDEIADLREQLYLSDSSISSVTSSESESEEEVIVRPNSPPKSLPKPPTKTKVPRPIASSTPIKPNGIKAQNNCLPEEQAARIVSQTHAVNCLKDSLSRYKAENARLRDENFTMKGQIAEIRNLKAKVLTLEKFEERATMAERRLGEQTAYVKNLQAEDQGLKLEVTKLKAELANAQKASNARINHSTLHIPIQGGAIVDDAVISNDHHNDTIICYEGAPNVNSCLHVSLTHEGKIEELKHRKRKLPAKYNMAPPPKIPRPL